MNKDEIIQFGLSALFERYSYANSHLDLDDVKSKVFDSGLIDSILSSTNFLEKGTRSLFESYLRHANLASVALSPFVKKGVEFYSSTGFIESNLLDFKRGDANCILSAAERNIDFDWKNLFHLSYKYGPEKSRYIQPAVRSVLNKYAEYEPDSFEAFVKDSVFKTPGQHAFSCRGMFYKAYIANGSLTKEEARKIRSESSAEASEIAVKALVDNEELYPNYDDLVLVISDSKHERVLITLAMTLPIHLLPSIMGTDSQYVLGLVERRMEAHERAQEAELKINAII